MVATNVYVFMVHCNTQATYLLSFQALKAMKLVYVVFLLQLERVITVWCKWLALGTVQVLANGVQLHGLAIKGRSDVSLLPFSLKLTTLQTGIKEGSKAV